MMQNRINLTSRTITHLILFLSLTVFSLCCLLSCGGGGGNNSNAGQIFEITMENIAQPTTLIDSRGQAVPIAFAPAVFAVHSKSSPFYTFGQLAPANGIDSYAEAGDPSKLIESVQSASGVTLFGIAQTPVGEMGAGLLAPGLQYKADIAANDGESLSLILAFLQGNDLVIGTSDRGIRLFDGNGEPISGDITSQFALIDVGTEVNEAPGEGPNQDPRQLTPTSGFAESQPVGNVSDPFTYPPVTAMVRISIAPK